MDKFCSELQRWDGKQVDLLKRFYLEWSSRGGFVEHLLEALKGPDTERAASWLIKHHLEHDQTLDAAEAGRLFACCGSLADWQAQLHVLQTLHWLPIAARDRKRLELFVRTCLSHNKPFVRAWAYSGMDILARRFPALRHEVDAMLSMAMTDEPASVRARIRQLRAKPLDLPARS